MIRRSLTTVVVPFLLFSSLASATAQQETTVAEAKTVTKVSELHEKGRYKRITETFMDGVLTAKREEVSLRNDRQINVVFVKLFRDGEMIYTCTCDKDKNRTIRSYYHKGKMLAMEGDEDGDNVFETLILFNPDGEPVEAFERNKDGTVTQWSRERLSTLKTAFNITKP